MALPASDTQPNNTLKVYGSFSQMSKALQAARNTLAIAMRDYALEQTPEAKQAMTTTQAEVNRLEQECRESRQILQAYAAQKTRTQGKTS